MTFQLILEEIKNNLKKILDDLSISDVNFSVEVAKPGFGDVSSNTVSYTHLTLPTILLV